MEKHLDIYMKMENKLMIQHLESEMVIKEVYGDMKFKIAIPQLIIDQNIQFKNK